MLDFGFLPAGSRADVQVFDRVATVTNLQWLTWEKPRGVSMVYAVALGGGAGGGGGFTGIAASARGGGGSGASGGVALVLIPAILIPDVLFVQVGAGGAGVGSGGGTAGSGLISHLSVAPDNGTTNLVISSSLAGPGGGGTGTAAAVGAAGAVSTNSNLGNWQGLALGSRVGNGQVGVAGGAVAGAIGTAQTIPTGLPIMAGAGGAGTTSADFAGGAITGVASSRVSEARPATPAAGSFDGSAGPQLWKPFFSFGGCGGSASNAGVGGRGGDGAIGAGGGGGGGGTTGGRGGDGGPGLVVIVSW